MVMRIADFGMRNENPEQQTAEKLKTGWLEHLRIRNAEAPSNKLRTVN
jgi:hypothetical protein